jgi:Arc/MetJ-type ribon-helix-helix transcriptional regulator
MTIHLPEDVERSIEAEVRRGSFASADDALATAWRLFQRGKPTRRTRGQPQTRPLTAEEINQQMLADGLISRLPDPAEDSDDDDVPITIKGEPLSETIIRERR